MPTIPSVPATFTTIVPTGAGSTNFTSVTFAIPAGSWHSGTWQTAGEVNKVIDGQWAMATSEFGDFIPAVNDFPAYNGSASVSTEMMTLINAAAGGTLNINLLDSNTPPYDTELSDSVSSFVLILNGGSSSGSATSGSSSRSAISSGSSGDGCVQAGIISSVPIAYDSTDPLYADSAGYWVVFDDTIKVIADIDTPGAWSMNFDDPTNPSTAFVGVDGQAVNGNYFINYYFPLPASSSSSSSLTPTSSSSSSGSGADVGLFVSTFCVTGGSGSSGSLASAGSGSSITSGQASASGSSSLTSAGSSSQTSASGSSSLFSVSSSSFNSSGSAGSNSGQPSASSSSGGASPCNAYKDDYFNVPFDENYRYWTGNEATWFYGTNSIKLPVLTGANKKKFQVTVYPIKGVCVPSNGDRCSNDPNTSWTNFQHVLTDTSTTFNKPWKDWTFNYIGETNPVPDGSIRCHTYESLPGPGVGFVKGENVRAGVRIHLEYCPLPTPPAGTPLTNLHWLQVMWSNTGFLPKNCEGQPLITNDIDNGDPYFTTAEEFGHVVPTSCESKTSVLTGINGVALVDHSQLLQIDHPEVPIRIFRAETFLCVETTELNSKGGKIVNVYNGVQWGFQLAQL